MKNNLIYKDPLIKYKKGDKFNIDFIVGGLKDKVDEATKNLEKFKIAMEACNNTFLSETMKKKLIKDLTETKEKIVECEEKIEEKPKRDPRKRKLVIRRRRNI